MKKPMTVLTIVLGLTLAVLVAGSASAASPKKKAKSATPTTKKKSPEEQFTAINGSASAASDHVIVGSSAFPNFTKGAVDNYYSLAHSHVDNSPFAEGTASPADTGPVGQTAAAGNTQQPQYADARWPGKPEQATYGNQGGPYAAATAAKYRATADASEATNGLSGPGLGGSKTLPVPLGFDGRLREALASWKAKWRGPLGLAPAAPPPAAGVPKAPLDVPRPPLPKAGVGTPGATVPTPVGTVTTPTAAGASPAPPVNVPTPTLPSAGAARSSRSLAAFTTSKAGSDASASGSGDGESVLTSSTLATLVPTAGKSAGTKKGKTKTSYALVTSGESSLKRVTLGGGQIVIEGIHVTASIVNDGTTPTNKAAVSIASATIGGVPVTIDQDGVHLAGQGQGVPYQQASDALNGALKQAGIQLFLVAPEIKTNTCGGQSGMGAGAGGSSSNSSSSSSSSSQSGSGTDSCDQSGTGADTGCNQTGTSSDTPSGVTPPGIPTPPSSPSSDQSNTPTSSCDQTGAYGGCGQASSGSSTGTSTTSTTTTTTTTSGLPTSPSPGSSDHKGTPTTTPSSSCDTNGATPPTGCGKASTKPSTTGPTSPTSSTSAPSSSNFFDTTAATGGAGEETVRATGLHVVFTQPVNQPGVPAQFVEHILGEVFLDSLATPAAPLPKLGLGLSASSCLGGRVSSGTTSGGGVSGGGLSAGGSSSAGSLGTSGSGGAAFGSASQSTPGSSATGTSLPAAFATAMRKPLWLLLAYLVWQALVIGTGWSLWNWRKGGAS